ncbi:MAG: hypothetical protein H6765_09215 [Candidatus Peribacteria bacterium]|nr:MAG: hypothetical protein H6765_09215 [Candidatus Peribacteria bacterium]
MIDNLQASYALEVNQVYEQIKTLDAQITANSNGNAVASDVATQMVGSAQSAYQALQNQVASLQQEKFAKLAEIEAQIAQVR